MSIRRMPNAAAIFSYWRLWLDANKQTDPLPSECFACTSDKFPLERAHILARSDGGSDDVANLHLLCRYCHNASELLEADAYFDWFERREFLHSSLEMLASSPTGGVTKFWDFFSALDTTSHRIALA